MNIALIENDSVDPTTQINVPFTFYCAPLPFSSEHYDK